MIELVTFKKNHRKIFPKGFEFKPDEKVTILVGDQGSGKSSLIRLIASHLIDAPMMKRKLDLMDQKDAIKVIDIKGNSGPVYHIDAEHDNPRSKGHFDEVHSMEFQIQARWASHGQSSIGMFGGLQKSFKKPGIVLLDEPETALSPRSVKIMVQGINNMVKAGNQVIVATHHPWIIGSFNHVYSMESRTWLTLAGYELEVSKPWNPKSIAVPEEEKKKAQKPVRIPRDTPPYERGHNLGKPAKKPRLEKAPKRDTISPFAGGFNPGGDNPNSVKEFMKVTMIEGNEVGKVTLIVADKATVQWTGSYSTIELLRNIKPHDMANANK